MKERHSYQNPTLQTLSSPKHPNTPEQTREKTPIIRSVAKLRLSMSPPSTEWRSRPRCTYRTEGNHSLTPVWVPSRSSVPHSPSWRWVVHLPSNSPNGGFFPPCVCPLFKAPSQISLYKSHTTEESLKRLRSGRCCQVLSRHSDQVGKLQYLSKVVPTYSGRLEKRNRFSFLKRFLYLNIIPSILTHTLCTRGLRLLTDRFPTRIIRGSPNLFAFSTLSRIECRWDERLKANTEGSTHLTYTGLRGGLEHIKIETS